LKSKHRILNPKVTGSSPPRRITQTSENKRVTNPKADSINRQSENLVSGLFSDSEIDADLKLIIERWPEISVDLQQAIVRMVE
jgi:hypothetical protein